MQVSVRKKELVPGQYRALTFYSLPPSYNSADFEQDLRGILPADAKLYGKSIVSDDGPADDRHTTVMVVIQLPDESDWTAVGEKLKTGKWKECDLTVSQFVFGEPSDWFQPPRIEDWLDNMQQFIDVLDSPAGAQTGGSTMGSPLQLPCLDPGTRPERLRRRQS